MKKTCYLFTVLILVLESVDCDKVLNDDNFKTNATVIRYKRYLDFIPKSRMFFRANIKENVLSANQIIAFAYGYRANFPIENDIKIRRRDVFNSMEEVINQHGFSGRDCVSKMLCDASTVISPKSGMFHRLYQLIFRITGANEEEAFTYDRNNCKRLSNVCPLKLINLSPYTDIQ